MKFGTDEGIGRMMGAGGNARPNPGSGGNHLGLVKEISLGLADMAPPEELGFQPKSLVIVV